MDLPVKGQVVARPHLDCVLDLLVSQDVASDINRVHVLHRRVRIAPGRRPIVGGGSNALEGPLVDTVDEDTLESKSDIQMQDEVSHPLEVSLTQI